MRFEWFAIIVVLIDIAAKLAIGMMGLATSFTVGHSGVVVDILHNASQPFEHFLSSHFNTSEWLLPGGLLVLFWWLFQKGRGFLSTSTMTALGAMLAVGGIITRLVDLMVYGNVVPLFAINYRHVYSITLNVGDIAVFAGLILLVIDLFRRLLTPRTSPVPLHTGKMAPISFDELPRGIDNIHVDVIISPTFTRITRQVINSLVTRYVRQGFGSEKRDKVRHQDFFMLQKAYVDMAQSAIMRAKDEGMTTLNLFYIALMKHMRKEIQDKVTAEIQAITDQQKAVSNEKAKWLLRNRNLIFNKVGKAMYNMLYRIEIDSLNKLRKSLFGEERHPLVEMFQAPLSFCASVNDDDIQLQHYLLLGHMNSDPHSFGRIDRILEEVFANNVKVLKDPTPPKPAETEAEDEEAIVEGVEETNVGDDDESGLTEEETTSERKSDSAEITGGNEYQRLFDNPSVLMAVENIDPLLNLSWTRHQLQLAWDERNWGKYFFMRRQRRFQHHQLALLRNALENANLLPTLIAAYETAEVYRESEGEAQPSVVHKLIDQKGALSGGENKFENIYRSTPGLPPKGELVSAIKRINVRLKGNLDEFLARFVFDFGAYRRDLRSNVLIQQAANQISVLSDDNDVLTSRSNNLLFEFVAPSELSDDQRVIRCHAIIKADLRGSTQITEELTRRKLNPATHFSRNFFSPINEVIETFGAEKVFIEGDAIILILNEYASAHGDNLIVSRACGLAAGMLRVMEYQNTQLAAHGLPQLELGIGIAFHNAPPNYLFDGDHRITISSAINRADRLSACAWALRKWFKGKASAQTHVAVYEPSNKARSQLGEKAQKDMVYNLNGVLMEETAFKKLQTEVRLKEQPHHIDEYWDSRLFTSRYPDVRGRFHPLVVREGAVREYDDTYEYLETPKVDGRNFYEVVYDRKVLEQLRTIVASAENTAKAAAGRS